MNLRANLSSSLLTYLENTHSAAVLTQGQGEEGRVDVCRQPLLSSGLLQLCGAAWLHAG